MYIYLATLASKKLTAVSRQLSAKIFIAIFIAAIAIGGSILFYNPVFATTGTNKTINFQGKVTNSDGTNVTDGSYSFTFKIYSVSSAGSAIWTETKSLTVTDGIFQTALGDSTSLPGSVDFNTDNIYLGIEFNGDGEMSPRVRFASVPQALNALKVAGLTVTDTTGTFTLTNGKTLTVQNSLTFAGTDSKTLTLNGSTTLADNAITFGGTEVLTLAATKNVTFADTFTTSGANPLTLTTSGSTNVTLPTTGTLATLAGAETLTNKTLTDNVNAFADNGDATKLLKFDVANVGAGTTLTLAIPSSPGTSDTICLQTKANCGSSSLAWSSLTNPSTSLSLAFDDAELTTFSSSSDTETFFTYNANSLTTGTAVKIASTSTTGGGSGSSFILDLSRSGTNSNSTHTAYGVRSQVTNTGTGSVNIAGYFSASGGDSNYGLLINSGNVGIGDTTPANLFVVGSGDTFQVNSSGAIAAATGITSSGTINFSGLSASSIVYTDGSKNLTSTAPTSGTLGYWSRSGTTLSPATSNDVIAIATTNTTGADLAITNTGAYTGTGIFNLTANSATTGILASLTGTGLTTGTLLSATGSYAPTTGPTNNAFSISLANAPTSSADTLRGMNLAITDSTALGNVVQAYRSVVTLTGNANKVARGFEANISSSSTTADTLNAGYFSTSATGNAARTGNNAVVGFATSSSTTADNLSALYGITSATGILTTGTRNNYGIVSQPASTAASTGGTSNIYGVFSNPSSTLSNPGTGDTVTNNVSAFYAQPVLTLASNCTSNCVSNQYGLYVADGTSSTNGTSTKYGIYVAPQTGADGNYGGYFGSNVGIGNAAPTASLYVDRTSTATSGTNQDGGVFNYVATPGSTTSASTFYDSLVANANSTANGIDQTNTNLRAVVGVSTYAGNNTLGSSYGSTASFGWNSSTGTISNAYGFFSALGTNNGTITNTYGAYIGDVTNGTQTNQAYGLYQVDTGARNYFAGNVGIGTSAPSVNLNVYRNDAGTGPLTRFEQNSTGDAVTSWVLTGTREWVAGIDNSDNDSWKLSSTNDAFATTPAITVLTGGNVGIGTSAPSNALEVRSTSTPQFRVAYDASNYATQTVASNGTFTLDTATTGNMNIGTGANAKTITIGNNTGATALAFTSGTGGIAASSTTVSGTAFGLTASSLTTGTALQITASALTTGSFFDINNGSSIFNVSQTAFTTSLPSNFTAAGDVAVAYDINFTNPTASYIKSAASLNIYSGETFNSSNLNLGTYNQGTIVFDTANTTTTALDFTNTTLTTGTGLNISTSALTTGKAVSITASSTGQTSANLLSVVQSGVTTGFTGAVAQFTGSSTTGSGSVLSVTGANTTAGNTVLVTANTVTQGTGMTLTATALTSGIGLSVSSSATAVTGDLGKFELTGNSGSSLTGSALKVGITGTSASGNSTALNVTNGNTGSSAYVARFNDDGTYTDTTAFVIDGTGNVGIGMTTPAAKVDINMGGLTGSTALNIAYASATTLAGTTRGFYIDGSNNVTNAAQAYVGGLIITPTTTALTGQNIRAYLSNGNGAVTSSSGNNLWSGFSTTIPTQTQTGGTLTTYGLEVNGGTLNSGTSYGVFVSMGAGGAGTARYAGAFVGGNVGIGTSAPTAILHTSTDGINTIRSASLNGGTADHAPVLDLFRTGVAEWTMGISATTGEFAISANPTSSSYTDTNLKNAAKLTILTGGNVGIGTTNPSAPFEVKGTGTGATIAKFTDTNTTGCTLATGGTIACSSDRNLKKNIGDINYGLNQILQLRPVEYNWRTESDSTVKSLGFIAQEVETVIPKLVSTDSDTGYKQLNTIGIVPVLAKSIQELNQKIDNAHSTTPLSMSVNSNGLLALPQAKAITGQIDATNGEVVIKTNQGRQLFRIDQSGNAFIAGTLTVGKLVAGEIDGLQVISDSVKKLTDTEASNSALITNVQNQNRTLSDSVASTSATLSNLSKSIDDLFNAYGLRDSKEASIAAVTVAPQVLSEATSAVALNSVYTDGIATFSGQLNAKSAHIQDNLLVESVLNVVDMLTTRRMIVSELAHFLGDVVIKGNLAVSGWLALGPDSAGTAVITKDQQYSYVKFSRGYDEAPLINATISLPALAENASAAEKQAYQKLENDILAGDFKYIVTDRGVKGFSIKINKTAPFDLTFNWTAVTSIKNNPDDTMQAFAR